MVNRLKRSNNRPSSELDTADQQYNFGSRPPLDLYRTIPWTNHRIPAPTGDYVHIRSTAYLAVWSLREHDATQYNTIRYDTIVKVKCA